jgi:hypothetical protein
VSYGYENLLVQKKSPGFLLRKFLDELRRSSDYMIRAQYSVSYLMTVFELLKMFLLIHPSALIMGENVVFLTRNIKIFICEGIELIT